MSGNVDEWCWPDKRYFDDIERGIPNEQEMICRQIDQSPNDFIRSCQQVKMEQSQDVAVVGMVIVLRHHFFMNKSNGVMLRRIQIQ